MARPNLPNMAVFEKDNRPISLSSSECEIRPGEMWGLTIFSHPVAFSAGNEIRKRLSLLLGHSANRPRMFSALSTKLLSIWSSMASLVKKLLKVE